MILLFKKNENQLYANVMKESASQKISVAVVQENELGQISSPIYLSRSDVLLGKSALLQILNLSIGLSTKELDIVKKKLQKIVQSIVEEPVLIEEKAPFERLYLEMCKECANKIVCKRVVSEGTTVPEPVFVRDGWIFIKTSQFNSFLRQLPSAKDYSRLEVLKLLKLHGLLDVRNRVYDKKVKIGGVSEWYYVVRMAEIKEEEAIEIE